MIIRRDFVNKLLEDRKDNLRSAAVLLSQKMIGAKQFKNG